MGDLPESVKLDFTTPVGKPGTVDLSLKCFDMHRYGGKDERVSYISFGYGPWDLDNRSIPEDPEDRELYEKYGPDRLAISINASDDIVYLTPRTAKAMLTILQQFIK